MAKRRKHRLVVEATFSKAVTEKVARLGLSLLLERIDLDANPVWDYDNSPYVNKLTVKEFSRVVAKLLDK